MIFVTGDTHNRHDYGKIMSIGAKYPNLTMNDYIIIAGDFGGVWCRGTIEDDLKTYKRMKCMVLFVDGNHENFDLIDTFPVEEWHGGKVHVIAPNILHLMRGQVFDIDGKTFFTFGGATSVDVERRVEGISWWRQEVPSDEDMQEANKNLEKVGYKVDYIVTHSCDERALYYPPLLGRDFQKDVYPENRILSYFEEKVDYKHWFFGHYHMDGELTPKKTVLYNEYVIIE